MSTGALSRTLASTTVEAWTRRDRRRIAVAIGPAVRDVPSSRGLARTGGGDAPRDPAPLGLLPIVPRRGEAATSGTDAPAIAPPRRGEPIASGDADLLPPHAEERLSAAVAAPVGHSRPRCLLAAVLLHALGFATVVEIPPAEREGGGEASVMAVEFVAPDATDTVDAAAGARPAAEPVEEKPPVDEETAARSEPTTPVVEPVEAVVAPPEPPPVAEPEPPDAAMPPVLAARAAREDFVVPPPAVPAPPTAEPVAEAPPTAEPVTEAPPTAEPAIAAKPVKAPPKKKPARDATASTRAPRRVASATAGSGDAATDRRAGGGAERGAAAAANQGDLRSWRAAVLAALARAKVYPEEARSLERGGRAAVSFTIRSDGTVGGVALAASSGVGSLDAATLALPRRARFPPMPAGAGASQSFTAGVRYDLR